MSAFASANFQSHDYALYRPTYSIEFFKYIFKFSGLNNFKNDNISIVDIGSGPATCELTYIPYLIELLEKKLLNLNKINIYVTDVSQTMITEAERSINEKIINNHKFPNNLKDIFNIKYIVIEGEKLNELIKDNSIDLIIAAECVHWIQPESWLKSMNKILKPETGVLAYWGYVDPVFIDDANHNSNNIKNANIFYNEFVYETEGKLGSYWQQPGRNILRGLCRDINNKIFEDLNNWNDVITVYRDPSKGNTEILERLENKDVEFQIDDKALQMIKKLTVKDFVHYANTWSSSHKWNIVHPKEEEISKLFFEGFNKITKWDLTDKVVIEMKTFYTFAKKH